MAERILQKHYSTTTIKALMLAYQCQLAPPKVSMVDQLVLRAQTPSPTSAPAQRLQQISLKMETPSSSQPTDPRSIQLTSPQNHQTQLGRSSGSFPPRHKTPVGSNQSLYCLHQSNHNKFALQIHRICHKKIRNPLIMVIIKNYNLIKKPKASKIIIKAATCEMQDPPKHQAEHSWKPIWNKIKKLRNPSAWPHFRTTPQQHQKSRLNKQLVSHQRPRRQQPLWPWVAIICPLLTHTLHHRTSQQLMKV